METAAIRPEARQRPAGPVLMIEIAVWLIYIAAMVVKCLYFQFSNKLNVKPYFFSDNSAMLLSTFTSVLLTTVLALAVFNTRRLKALFITDIVLSALIFADTLYYRYYYNALTIPVLHQIGLVSSIGESAENLMKWKDLIFIADMPLIAAGLALLSKRKLGWPAGVKILKRLAASAVILGISFGLFQVAWSNSSHKTFSYNSNYVINNLGLLYFHYYDIKNYVTDNLLIDKSLTASDRERISAFFDGRRRTAGVLKYTGAAEGRNLIVIQMESIQQFIISKKLNGREITPNMNKFINDSAYFDNFFYQTGGGNTSDAEFLANTSLYPLKDGSVYFRFPGNTYEALPKLLKAKGYETYALHANNPNFWNRADMYKALGFDHFINSSDFAMDEEKGWGLSDESFLRQSLDKLDTSVPFYAFMITLTSHHPYNYFDDYKDIDVGQYEGTLIGNYVKAAHYVDACIGRFLDDLKRRGLYDNSVIIMYGDHNAIPKDQADMLKCVMPFDYNNFNWTNIQKTACFIRFPGMDNKGVQKTICGEIDILPTVANLMGFTAPHAMGKDMFNTEKGYAVLRNSTVITDEFEYLNADGSVYDRTGGMLPEGAHAAEIAAYQDQLALSDIILKKNALRQGSD